MEERLSQSNKGFTLVEICVTMVIFSILATITTMSLISWTEYSEQIKQDERAELVYMALRNKISLLRANGALDEYKNWADNDYKIDSSWGISYQNSLGDTPTDLYYAVLNNAPDTPETAKTIPEDMLDISSMISSYINDKDVLDACIAIEYSSDGTIYSVFYCNRCRSFVYNNSPTDVHNINLKNNRNSDTFEKILGDHVAGKYIAE